MAKRLVLELTDRCNLHCAHCYDGRHGGRSEMAFNLLQAALEHARSFGIGEVSFTGGEPTLYRRFRDAVAAAAARGYRYSLVTNGWDFERAEAVFVDHRDALQAITFSLDGVTTQTHDAQRGRGSFERVIASAQRAAQLQLPFTFHFAITRLNRHELGEVIQLAADVGAGGIRFGPFLADEHSHGSDLSLSDDDWRQVVAWFYSRPSFPVKLALAPGFPDVELFPCASLRGEEFNLDWRGRLSHCCHMTGHFRESVETTTLASLTQAPGGERFAEAFAELEQRRLAFRDDKTVRRAGSAWKREDELACRFCVQHIAPELRGVSLTGASPIPVAAALGALA